MKHTEMVALAVTTFSGHSQSSGRTPELWALSVLSSRVAPFRHPHTHTERESLDKKLLLFC